MKTIKEQIAELRKVGYRLPTAQMKVAHDIILLAMHRCGFRKSSTIKGGVVMSHLTGDIRRTTMDMDIAFVRRSISEVSVQRFVKKINCIPGVRIAQFGTIEELNHDDYRGKRVYLDISDGSLPKPLRTKIDIGVHARKEIAQIEYAFELMNAESRANLYANSGEQIFVEKLLSLLRYGAISRRPKDIFDMYYLREKIDIETFRKYDINVGPNINYFARSRDMKKILMVFASVMSAMVVGAETIEVTQANIGNYRTLTNGNTYRFVENIDWTAPATESATKVEVAEGGTGNYYGYVRIIEKPTCEGGTVEKGEGGVWVITPNNRVETVIIGNPPEEAKVVVKLNGYNVPSSAFKGFGEDGIFSLALNPEVVQPKVGELDEGEPFVVGVKRQHSFLVITKNHNTRFW